MPIREFSAGRKRRRICFWGGMPDIDGRKAFLSRGYTLVNFAAKFRTTAELAVTDSVVISQQASDLKGIYRDLERYGSRLLALDCRVYVRVAGDKLQGRERLTVVNALRRLLLPAAGLQPMERERWPIEQREREGVPLAPYVFICDTAWGWEDIAQTIADNPAGDPPNLELSVDALKHSGKKMTLRRESSLLVRRAFSDCAQVHLQQMHDGLSGVSVFRAHMALSSGLEGEWPVSYFVKLGNRKKIATEYFTYQAHALKYIPFNLAPRLTLERCALGAHEGIIVGDFVEQAEPLSESARNGRAVQALGTLFARTLGAWRHAATKDELRSLPQAMADLLPSTLDIPEDRKALIRSLGGTADLARIRGLLDRCDATPVLIGTIHGDLNASNILVRLSDAVLIDFEQLKEGRPLLYDAASVEAGLLVEGFAHDRRTPETWRRSIEPLYDSPELFEWHLPCHPKDASAWFYDCVRQIRLNAKPLELERGQYAAALALALVKKSCNPHPFRGRRAHLRAAAFVLGENILNMWVTDSGKGRV